MLETVYWLLEKVRQAFLSRRVKWQLDRVVTPPLATRAAPIHELSTRDLTTTGAKVNSCLTCCVRQISTGPGDANRNGVRDEDGSPSVSRLMDGKPVRGTLAHIETKSIWTNLNLIPIGETSRAYLSC